MIDKRSKPTSAAGAAVFSTEWWDLRRAILAEIGREQETLRRTYPLPFDSPEIHRAEVAASDAALALELYGPSSRGTNDGAYERNWLTATAHLQALRTGR